MNTATGVLFLGIDMGTSACRLCVIDAQQRIQGFCTIPIPAACVQSMPAGYHEQSPYQQWAILKQGIAALAWQLPLTAIARIAIAGTSASVLLCTAQGEPLTPLLLYNDQRAQVEAAAIRHLALPPATLGATSSLAKVLYLQARDTERRACYALHQADWLTAQFSGQYGISDENNSLKLGYDPEQRQWSAALSTTGLRLDLLPKVLPPGSRIGTIAPACALALGLSPQTAIIAGTTDSTAAFIAANTQQLGDAVTTLGSTLVLKIRSAKPVFDAQQGIYSHRLGNTWLVGGASNSGGAVLRHYFSQAQLDALTPHLKPEQPTGLQYYPLLQPGERFPIHDPDYLPRIYPKPADERIFLQGLLEGMANIERQGYQRLQQLGAGYPRRVYTSGGGAKNMAWQIIRHRCLGVPVQPALQTEAAYGCALLAQGLASQYH